MKKHFLFFLILGFTFVELHAEDKFYISKPANGQTFNIPSGQSTINIEVCWVFQSDTLNYGAWRLSTDVGTFNNITSCYTVQNVPYGSKTWTLVGTSPTGGTISTSVQFNVVLTTVNIWADNNFTDNSGQGTHGSIAVDGGTYTAPYQFQKNTGASATLGAVSPQTDNQGYQRLWYTGSPDPSDWRKNGEFKSYNQTYSFPVTSSDNDATYQAQLRQGLPPIIANFSQYPDPLYNGGTGYVYAHLSQGIGNITYTWTEQHYPAMTVSLTLLGDHCQVQYFVPYYTNFQIFIFCTATNAFGSNSKTYLFHGYIVPYYSSASLAFETNGEIIDENPVLVSSIDNPGVNVTDYYLVNKKIMPENEKINLLLHEATESRGSTSLDQVELWKVKAGPNDFIAVTDVGEIVSYKKPDKPNQVILNDTLDITNVLADRDTIKLVVKKGDRIKVLQPGNTTYSTDELFSVLCAQTTLQEDAGLLTENKSTNNKDKYHFRPGPSTVCKKINTSKNGSINIEFTEDLLIDYFALVKNKKTAKLEKLKLVDAINNEKEEVWGLLAEIDAQYNKINPGDKVCFTFENKNKSDDNDAYILKTVGRYEESNPKMSKKASKTEALNAEINSAETKLIGNYPNPFNPITNISYYLKENTYVELTIINSLGQEVKKLVSENQAAGNYSIPLDGSKLSSGIYIYRLQVGNQVFTRKMMLIK